MKISVSEAKSQLTELVRRAEAGEEVVLTRHGRAAAMLVPVHLKPSRSDKEALLLEVQASAKASAGPDAAHSQDFLYDDDGLPK